MIERQVEIREGKRWRHAALVAWLTTLLFAAFMSMFAIYVTGCGRGKGGPTCPRGVDTGERRDAPTPCEVRP